jgi:hypothetical protein
LVLALDYLSLVVYIVVLIGVGVEKDWPMYWTIFIIVDFPASLGVVWLSEVFCSCGSASSRRYLIQGSTSPFNDIHNFLYPLAENLGSGEKRSEDF